MLTDTAVKNLKPTDKPAKYADSGGLYLYVTPSGGKLWRQDYRFGGKYKTLAFGKYPEVSLANARERRDEARKLLANGADPGAVKKAQKAAVQGRAENTFKAIAAEWFATWKGKVSEQGAKDTWNRLEKDVFPWLGETQIEDVNAVKILDVLRRMEARGVREIVRRTKGNISNILDHAIVTGRNAVNPCHALSKALEKGETKHYAALLDPARVGQLLRDIDGYSGRPEVVAALKILPLVFARPGELRRAKWADIDLDRGEWCYVASKTQTNHLVPLSTQAVAILRELQPITGENRHGWVFPGLNPGKPISEATINQALRRMGYCTQTEHTGHGFRAMARTLLAEELEIAPEIIEHQLAHKVPDVLGQAYNRTRFLKARRPMMQRWSDFLDRLKTGADVLEFRRA